MELQDRLSFFRELLACDPTIYYWCFDGEGQLIASSCPEETVFFPLLRHSGCLEYALTSLVKEPMILSNSAGLTWAAVWEFREEERYRLHMIGPCLAFSLTPQLHEQAQHLIAGSARTDSYKKRLMAGLDRIPNLPMTVLYRYAAMLGRCVTGEQTALTQLHHQSAMENVSEKQPPRDRMNVYRAERMLLRMVRDGDLNSGAAMRNASNTSTVQPYVPDPLGQAQIACTILTSLCTRAAIEGGLSPEVAYSTGDGHIRRLFQAQTITEVTAVKNQMYQDFIEKVHACRNNPKFTPEIQSCCDYMELHAEEPLTLELLAERLGYNKYYLSRRFKAEVGCTINNYLQIARVERAKMLLVCTDQTVADIAAALQFVTVSHFSVTFKRITGKPPAQYRAEQRST
jgi:AraC-like DNA-binding protein